MKETISQIQHATLAALFLVGSIACTITDHYAGAGIFFLLGLASQMAYEKRYDKESK